MFGIVLFICMFVCVCVYRKMGQWLCGCEEDSLVGVRGGRRGRGGGGCGRGGRGRNVIVV